MRKPRPLRERFEEKVERVTESGCWIWLDWVNQRGYGWMRVGSMKDGTRRIEGAHRIAYELYRGPIPDGLVIDHLCRVPSCVNPWHLRAVTQRENVLAPGSQSPSKALSEMTHCFNGHEFTSDNTIIDSHGRRCRTCRMAWRALDRSTEIYKEKARIRTKRWRLAQRTKLASSLALLLLLLSMPASAQVPEPLPFNDAYWNRIREYVWHAYQQDHYVAIVLSDSWGVKHALWGDWQIPWTQEAINAFGTHPHPEIEAFVRKSVNETCQFGNVVYVTGNEENQIPAERSFYEWMVSVVRDEERKPDCAGMVHLIGTGLQEFSDGPYDFIVTHQRTPISGPFNGKWLLDSEHNPEYPPEQEASYFSKAREAGQAWAAWRGEANDADWVKRLELFKAVVDGNAPVGCFAPDPEDPLWGTNVTGAGQMKFAVEAAKSAVGEHCGTDHQGSLATLGLVADELRKQGYCASGPWTDAVAILAPDGWWEEYHAVSFATGCWAQDPAQLPKFRWWYTGTNPTPPGTCPSPLPDRSRLLWRLNCGTWCDATPTLHNDCGYCTSIGLGTMPDGVTPRCDCPARNECPDSPGYEGMCDDRLTCERYLIEAEAPVWHTDGTLVMDPNSAWRARQTGGTYIEACNGGSTKCTRVVQ